MYGSCLSLDFGCKKVIVVYLVVSHEEVSSPHPFQQLGLDVAKMEVVVLNFISKVVPSEASVETRMRKILGLCILRRAIFRQQNTWLENG